MVSHSHLSAENSESSPSRDYFADYGVSNPSSPKMVESEAAQLDFSLGSNESAANSEWEGNMGLGQNSLMRDIFKAVQHFSRQDRIDAVEERLKNHKLLNFLNAHGFSMKEVNEFTDSGVIQKSVNEHDLFDKRSMKDSCFPKDVKASPEPSMSSAPHDLTPEEGEIPSIPCQTVLNTKASWSSIVSADAPRRP